MAPRKNFNSITAKGVTKGVALVDFSAPWCGPCKAMAPVIKRLRHRYRGRVAVIKVNIDKDKKLAARFKIQTIPTLVVLDNGKEVKRFIGLQREATLAKSLDRALS
ncbi:MAG: thioredoxin [Desulfobacteraceae bacterium]|nr:thioredoxin [Desulfobacteraceae bacterium]